MAICATVFKGVLDTIDFTAWYAGSLVRCFDMGRRNVLPEFRTEVLKQAVNEVRLEKDTIRKSNKPRRTIGFL